MLFSAYTCLRFEVSPADLSGQNGFLCFVSVCIIYAVPMTHPHPKTNTCTVGGPARRGPKRNTG